MSALPKIFHYTPQEYLRLEREAEYKSEYFQGEIFAMARASENHNMISRRVSGSLEFKSINLSMIMQDIYRPS